MMTGAASAQTYQFRMQVDPEAEIVTAPAITLTGGDGTGMNLDAAGAASGVLVYGDSRTFTWLNASGSPVNVSGFTLSNTTNFEITSETCTSSEVADGVTCQAVLSFKATDNGTYSGTLQINLQ